MNASDIIKKKQNICLYRAYYNPTIYQSTIFSTIESVSSILSGDSSYKSTITNINTYICPPHIISYNIINDIINGKNSLDNTVLSELEWKKTTSTTQYYYSGNTITSSIILSGPSPIICTEPTFNICINGSNGGGGKNSSDIVTAKNDEIQYIAYYNPTVFNSTIVNNIITFSSIASGTTSYTSTFDTIYTYECNPTFNSYQNANNINNGSYLCGSKQLSELEWKNTTSSILLYFSTGGTVDTSTITSSIVLRGPEPDICQPIQLYQGLDTVNNNCKCTQYCIIEYCNFIDSGY